MVPALHNREATLLQVRQNHSLDEEETQIRKEVPGEAHLMVMSLGINSSFASDFISIAITWWQ